MSSRYYLIFIVFSFLVSLCISLLVVNNRVEQTISGVIKEHTESSSELSAAMIEQYFSTRVQLAKDLSEHPLLISSVMGTGDSSGRLKDFVEAVRLLGKKEPIGLFDILGDTVYSNIPKERFGPDSQWFNDIINAKAENAIFLVGADKETRFSVALPIKYNGLVEGVLVVSFSTPLSKFLNPLTKENSFNAVQIRGPNLLHQTRNSLDGYSVTEERSVEGTRLDISYLVNQEAVLEEQLKVMLAITLSIVLGLLLSFLALAVLGKRLLLNPYKKLEALQVETEDALRELENLKYVVDQHSIVAITDIKGTILFANEKFSEISGYSNEELVGQNHRILNSGYHDKSFFTDMYKTISKGKVFRSDICNRTKNGELYWVDTTINPLKNSEGKIDRYIAIRSDITKLKLAEEQIVSDNLRMQLATNASGIGIWEWDLISNDLVWDDWMFSLYGVSPSMFTSNYEAWKTCIHPDDLEQTQRLLQDAIDGEATFEPEFRIRKPNGEVKTLKAKAQIFRDEENRPTKMIGVNYDITDRVEALEMISDARDKAQQAAEAKSEFLANMSHEIRTPMNGVIGMLELLKQTDMNKDQSHKVKVAASSAQSLLTLLNDILDLSKIEAGKLELENIDFDLSQLLSDSIEALSNLVEDSQNTQLLIDIADIKANSVMGDPGRIRQIVTNLLSNAIKFTSKGEIVLTASLVDTGDGVYRMTCSVRDSGIGIPEEKLSTLFQQFTQVDASTTRKYGGTGLGLSISKHLCQLMNGGISVTSKEGQGSCFTFEIELGIPDRRKQSIYPASLKSMNVLVVDTNPVSSLILGRQLDVWGINSNIVDDYEKVPDLVAESQNQNDAPYNVVVMDTQGDEEKALELCKQIELRSTHRKLRLVLLMPSGHRYDSLKNSLGISIQYIYKPVIPSLLMDLLIEANIEDKGLPEATSTDRQKRSKNGESGQQGSSNRRIFKEDVRVLLVEDNKVNQLVAQALLSAYGLEIVIANNGKEAIEILSNDDAALPFSLALMDCHMPEMDGYEATRGIRSGDAGHKYEGLPIVAMTANAMQGDREKCLASGMDDYVTKPINETLLQNALLKWIDRSNSSARVPESTLKEEAPVVWNQRALLDHLSGDEQKLKSIAKNYIAASNSQRQLLIESIEKGDWERLERLVAGVRKSLNQLGGEKLVSILERLEQAAKDEDVVRVESQMDFVIAAQSEFVCALENYLGRDE